MRGLAKALAGFLLIFVWHIPRLLYHLLVLSYAFVFANHPTLTASPVEHLKRANAILKRGRLSELLYAALELRFALERMAQHDLIFAEMASNRMLKEPSAEKKVTNLQRLAPAAAFPHEIWLLNRRTGQRIRWGQYKPLDRKRVSEIQGRLGDLLHPKDGLALGLPTDPWYVDTRAFLVDTADYLGGVCADNTPFFAFEGLDHIEMVRAE